jgi:ParB family chromosome partitioning protein
MSPDPSRPEPPAETTLYPVSQITVGPRHRKELGDIEGLARSIAIVGLIQPIVILASGDLVAGRRRLAAVQNLNWEMVPVRIVAGLDSRLVLLQAERDENTCRKGFTPSEAAAIATAIEDEVRKAAKERQRAAGGDRRSGEARRTQESPAGGAEATAAGNLPEAASQKGDTRDIVGAIVGLSGRTLEKAQAVLQAAQQDPQRYGDLPRKMDATGKVSPAYKELMQRKRAAMTVEEKEAERKAQAAAKQARAAEQERRREERRKREWKEFRRQVEHRWFLATQAQRDSLVRLVNKLAADAKSAAERGASLFKDTKEAPADEDQDGEDQD